MLWSTSSTDTITHTRATITTAVLTFVASLCFCLLSFYEHSRSIRPSFLLNIYLFLSILFDATRARTLWMLGEYHTIPIVFTYTLALRTILIVLESTEKRRLLGPQHACISPEATSGAFSRVLFIWLTSLFAKGYRRVLKLQDLYQLTDELSSERLHKVFQKAWNDGGSLFSYHSGSRRLTKQQSVQQREARRAEEHLDYCTLLAYCCRNSSQSFSDRIHLRATFSGQQCYTACRFSKRATLQQSWIRLDWGIRFCVRRHCSEFLGSLSIQLRLIYT